MVLFKESLLGHSVLAWMRTDETSPNGEFLASSDNIIERAQEITSIFVKFSNDMDSNVVNAVGVAPLVKIRYQISGEAIDDFADDKFNREFLATRDHLGMPSGLVQTAARRLFNIR